MIAILLKLVRKKQAQAGSPNISIISLTSYVHIISYFVQGIRGLPEPATCQPVSDSLHTRPLIRFTPSLLSSAARNL